MAHVSDEQLIAKTHNTARFFTENPHISWTILVFTILWGVYGYLSMPKRKDPEVPVRVAAALLSWPGASAENVEQRLTRVVERKLAENSSVERIESTTRAGVGVVTIMLDEDVKDTDEEFDDIWLKLSGLANLPEGASVEFLKDFGDTAALMLTVASPRASEVEVELRAQQIDDAIRAQRRDLPAQASATRAALVACFPHSLALREFAVVGRDFAAWASARGARDVRLFSGPGFLGLDLDSSADDASLLAQARAFASERLRGAELHPDVWRFAVVRDPAETEAKLRAVAGDKYSYRELDAFSEQIEKALQGVPQVARVTRSGVVSDTIYLDYSQEKLASYGLGPSQIQKALAARNITARGGAVEVQGKSVLIAPDGELRDEAELGGIVVGRGKSGQLIYLRDVVSITRAYETPRYVSYSSWKDPAGNWQRTRAITLSVTMKSGLQIADFGAAVDQKLSETRKLLPEDLVFERVSDQPQQVAENVDLFMSSLYEAIALVVIVALVGFWEWRSALLMALSIPITLAMTFGMMRVIGMDVQQISIGSLIIALGLLVDDPVVAGDAIKRDIEHGLPRRIAAWLGPTKLATAILFATGTNIVAYLPFLLLKGDSGHFVYSLPVVLTAALVASRLASMSFIPLLGMVLLRGRRQPEPSIEERKQHGFARWYARLVTAAVARRWSVLGVAVVLLGAGGYAVSHVKQSFFSKDMSYLSYVDVWLPEDAPLSATQEAAQEAEAVIREVGAHYGLQSVTSFVGGGGPRFWFSISPEQRQANYAQLIVRVTDKHHTAHMVGPLQAALSRRVAGARVDVHEIESGPAVGIPVSIRVAGEQPETLRELARQVEGVLRALPNAERVRDNWGADNFSVKLEVDPDRASATSVSNQDVVSSSALALNGSRMGTLQEGEHQLPIIGRLRASERQTLSDVENLYVYSSTDPNTKVPLRQVASFGFGSDTAKIARRNHVRTISIGAFPVPGALASEVLAAAMPGLRKIERALPPGYRLEVGGEHYEAEKSFKQLQWVLLTSVAAIFMMLVFQFKNALKPLVVFAAIPFGVVAALVSLWVMDTPFGFMAFLGVISLIGVIVSHVIVLFDFIEEQQEAGARLLDALIDAGILRLRPVLVTVGATVLGLVPLAMHGGALWEPLCWVQIGGLSFATVVTLVIVPVLYAIFVLDLKLVRWSGSEANEATPPRGSLLAQAAPLLVLGVLALGSNHVSAQSEPASALHITGQAGGLVADEMARRALATSPALVAKTQEVAAARAQLERAVLDYLPRLSGSASYSRLSRVDNPALGNLVLAPGAAQGPLQDGQPLVAAPLRVQSLQNVTSLNSALNIPLTDYVFRLVQAHTAAKAQLGAAQGWLEASRRKTAYEARALYYSWVHAELEAEVARQDLALGREHLARMRTLAQADSAAIADVARVEASVAGSELLLAKAENLATLERERCRIVMHDRGKDVYRIGEDLRASSTDFADFDSDELVRRALRDRPELSALRHQIQAYTEQAKVARAQGLPRIDLAAQSSFANPNQRYFPQRDEFHATWQVGAQLSFSPNDTLSGLKQAEVTRAKARGAEADRVQLLDAVRGEAVEALLTLQNARTSVEVGARRARAAEISYQARRERFLADMATTVELTEAQNELFRARLEQVKAQVALRLADARIAYVSGAAR